MCWEKKKINIVFIKILQPSEFKNFINLNDNNNTMDLKTKIIIGTCKIVNIDQHIVSFGE